MAKLPAFETAIYGGRSAPGRECDIGQRDIGQRAAHGAALVALLVWLPVAEGLGLARRHG